MTKPPPQTLWRLVVRLRGPIGRQRGLIAGSFVAVIAVIGMRVLEPWPLKFVFDRLVPGDEAPTTLQVFVLAAAALVVITTLRAVGDYLATVGLALAGNRIVTEMRAVLFAHLQRLSLSFHQRARTGDLVTRLIGDVGRLQEVAVTAVMPLVIHTLTLVAMLALMAWMHIQLFLVSLIVLPMFWIATRTHGSRIRTVARRQREREGAMGAAAAEAIGSMYAVQALGLEDLQDSTFARENAGSLKEGVQTKRLSARLERVTDVLIAIATGLVLWVGGRLTLRGELTPGDLIVFLAYLKAAYKPMRDLAKYTARIAKASASAERVLEILETAPLVYDRDDAIAAPARLESITFDDVTFGYEPERPVLNHATFATGPGRIVAIAGPSGSGKSTAINLLLRLYDVETGRILINGQDCRDFTVASYRRLFAVVPQAASLFGVTLRDNLRAGDDTLTDTQLAAAARLARAHDFIIAMPDGYDTVIGERGDTLSGGQQRRVSLARAILRDAPVLVLDEPTAGLDLESADAIRAALRDLRHDRVVFVITHDADTLGIADDVYTIKDGRLIVTRAGTDPADDESPTVDHAVCR